MVCPVSESTIWLMPWFALPPLELAPASSQPHRWPQPRRDRKARHLLLPRVRSTLRVPNALAALKFSPARDHLLVRIVTSSSGFTSE